MWASDQFQYGVDPKWLIKPLRGAKPYDRDDEKLFTIPRDILRDATAIAIEHRHTPRGDWGRTRGNAQEIGEIYRNLRPIVQDIAAAAASP